jgi:hypothetical protein
MGVNCRVFYMWYIYLPLGFEPPVGVHSFQYSLCFGTPVLPAGLQYN